MNAFIPWSCDVSGGDWKICRTMTKAKSCPNNHATTGTDQFPTRLRHLSLYSAFFRCDASECSTPECSPRAIPSYMPVHGWKESDTPLCGSPNNGEEDIGMVAKLQMSGRLGLDPPLSIPLQRIAPRADPRVSVRPWIETSVLFSWISHANQYKRGRLHHVKLLASPH